MFVDTPQFIFAAIFQWFLVLNFPKFGVFPSAFRRFKDSYPELSIFINIVI